VLINGIPAAVTGSAVSCGGVIIGSGSVVIGDTFTPTPFSGTSPAPSKPAPQAASRANVSGSAIPESQSASGVGNGTNNASAGGPAAYSMTASTPISSPTKDQSQAAVEPGYHVVQRPMSKTELLNALYGDASAKPDHFDRLNPGLGGQLMPGEMVVLGDPEGMECTQKEVELMEVAVYLGMQRIMSEWLGEQSMPEMWDILGSPWMCLCLR